MKAFASGCSCGCHRGTSKHVGPCRCEPLPGVKRAAGKVRDKRLPTAVPTTTQDGREETPANE